MARRQRCQASLSLRRSFAVKHLVIVGRIQARLLSCTLPFPSQLRSAPESLQRRRDGSLMTPLEATRDG